MTGLEIFLLVVGVIVIIVSFIFSSKADEHNNTEKNAELSNKQKEDIRNQILTIFDEQIEELKDKTEVSLDKMSNKKMLEMNEYSETILNEINRNHNEVMFLYDMLNEKKKEINNTVRDWNLTKKEQADLEKSKKASKAPEKSSQEPDIPTGDVGFMASEALMNREKKAGKSGRSKVLEQLDAVSETVADDIPADEEAAVKPKTRRKTSPAKTAAQRVRTAVKKETEREENKDITVFETGNNNEKILELSRQGKSNVEIAKELGLGIGEVKLVIDLFKGGR